MASNPPPQPRPSVGVSVLMLHPSSTTRAQPASSAPPTQPPPCLHAAHPTPTCPHPVILLGLRASSHGAGTWGLPGGHLEHGESFAACAGRESLEETGVALRATERGSSSSGAESPDGFKFLTATNDVFEKEGKHYVTLFVVAEAPAGKDGEVKVERREPEKCLEWAWACWGQIRWWAELMKRRSEGKEDSVGGEGAKELFLPIVSLIEQRPGVVPSL